MQQRWHGMLLPAMIAAAAVADTYLIQDDFTGELDAAWTWVRENPEGWRISESGLEIRVEPGNLWGRANDARNVLVRELPLPGEYECLAATLTVENQPSNQYEQVNLVWYYDDSNMVKIGLELVDGERCLVMGREEGDGTRTLALIPVNVNSLQVRLVVEGEQIRGQFRTPGEEAWQDAGKDTLPGAGPAKVSIQAYQGPADAEHWARITDYRLGSCTPQKQEQPE